VPPNGLWNAQPARKQVRVPAAEARWAEWCWLERSRTMERSDTTAAIAPLGRAFSGYKPHASDDTGRGVPRYSGVAPSWRVWCV